MGYDLEGKLVVGVASSALFDLSASDEVFRSKGEDEYRRYQAENIDNTLDPGVAFSFIRRLLSLNDLTPGLSTLVEVIILSRNDPETGLRVMRSVRTHDLSISRSIFTQGRSPYVYIGALSMALFLSADEGDVREALAMGFPAGQVLGVPIEDSTGSDLRIAFDFDGVLAGDESERVMQASGLEAFHANEVANAEIPLEKGRLAELLAGINRIQDVEDEMVRVDAAYNRRVHVAIVTARNAPSHERVVRTLQSWGVRANDAFFLGGIDKDRVLRVLKPHIVFDDQKTHLVKASVEVPSVHIPFGVVNE